MLETIKSMLKGNQIKDIFTVGFTDISNGVVEYHSMLQWLYFEFEGCLIEFESVEQLSKLQFRFVDSINIRFDVDDDMMITKSSVLNIVLTGGEYMGSKDIKKFSFANMQNETNCIICDALRIVLSNENMLFLDPTFLHGISIGGAEKEDFWKQNYSSDFNFVDVEI